MGEGAQERLLREFLGPGRVAQDANQEVVDRAVVAVDEQPKGVLDAGSGPLDQFRIGRCQECPPGGRASAAGQETGTSSTGWKFPPAKQYAATVPSGNPTIR